MSNRLDRRKFTFEIPVETGELTQAKEAIEKAQHELLTMGYSENMTLSLESEGEYDGTTYYLAVLGTRSESDEEYKERIDASEERSRAAKERWVKRKAKKEKV